MSQGQDDSNNHTLSNWFTGISTILAIGFFTLAIFFSTPPWSDLFLGMATSFVFLAVTNVIIRVQAWWTYRRVRDFFGNEIASSGLLLVYPDFEHSPSAVSALVDVDRVWRRPPGVNLKGLPFPEHGFPIEFDQVVAANDIQALLLFASTIEQLTSVPAALVDDRSVWADPTNSFCAAGLTSNHCIDLYRITDRQPLLSIDERGGHPIVHLASGHTLVDDDQREFGIIMRFAPDPERLPNRRWWFVAGLEKSGTPAAANFLNLRWRDLARQTQSDSDLLAVVSVARGTWHDPRLEFVLERSFGEESVRVVSTTNYLSSRT